ncbi:MAG: phosphoribosylglycinamide formyltransferase [Myxococcales bacterium]|nr:phosphoribosylglycinamide formyltransferase [Myxococcales bacterium]
MSRGRAPTGDGPLRVGALASGNGSSLRAIVRAIDEGVCPAAVVGVISDKPRSGALAFAQERGLASACVPLRRGDDRAAWDRALAEAVAAFEPDLIVLSGFMRVLGPPLLDRFPNRILNVHPALLPAFRGLDAPAQALAAGVRITGCTVHLVDAGVDTGPILAQAAVPVLPDDDATTLHGRIQAQEVALFPRVVSWIARGALALDPPAWRGDPGDPSVAFAWPAPGDAR